MLPEPPMPLPPPGIPVEPPPPQPALAAEPLPPPQHLPAGCSLHDLPPPQPSLSGVRDTFKSQPNTFGLFRIFDMDALPFHDPADPCDEYPFAPVSQPHDEAEERTPDNPFYPYPNGSSLRLGDWYWNQGSQKSRRNFKKLLDIVGGADFRPDDVRTTNWTSIDRTLGVLDPSGNCEVYEEWLNNDAGWKSSPVKISVPFPRRSLHPGPKDYTIKDFYHRSLTSIIRERVLDPTRHRLFHFEPYELRWRPPHKACDVGVHGELFTSKVFLDAHRALQDSVPEPGCTLPRRVVALMFWSDATHLTTFGTAKLWPLYVYFGNESKYKRCQPSANLCAHAAYFQTVSEFYRGPSISHG